MTRLDISVTGGSKPVLVLAGEADLTTLTELNSALGARIQAGARLLTVDLSRLRFADSAVIAALVVAARTLRDQGGRLELVHPRPAVARILELTGALQALGVRGDAPGGSRPEREPAPEEEGPPLPRLRVLLGSAGGDAVLRLAGEIDVTTTHTVAAAVDRCLRDMPVMMTIDLYAVSFCDCAGARALRDAQRRAAAAGTSFRLTGLAAPVRRLLTLIDATSLLLAVGEPARAPCPLPAAGATSTTADRRLAAAPSGELQADRDAVPSVPPAPPPDAVAAARKRLNEQHATGIERLLWELDKQPMPDVDAIKRAIAAAGAGDADSIGPALVLLQSVRLGVDRLEARAIDAAHAAWRSNEMLAAVLGLPSADAAAAWHQWLSDRRGLPHDDPPPGPRAVPARPADAATRAGRRAHQAAARVAQIAQRLDLLRAVDGRRQPAGLEDVERSAAHAGEARILAAEASDRATLGLLRAAEALEQCAAGYEQLASADTARRDEHRQEAAWYWHTAQEYRQLAEQQYRARGTRR